MLKSTHNPLFLTSPFLSNPFFSPLMEPVQKNFEFLVSFTPMAPFFGVPWAFTGILDPKVPAESAASASAPVTPVESARVKRKGTSNSPTGVASVKKVKTPVKPKERNQFEADGAFATKASQPIHSVKKQKIEAVNIAPIQKVIPSVTPLSTEGDVHAPAFDFEKTRSVISVGLKNRSTPIKTESGASQGTSSTLSIGKKPVNLLTKAPAKPDDLKLIKGVGPKLEAILNTLGIYQFEQLVNYTAQDLQWIDDNLEVFKGRALRDDWVEQARALMAAKSAATV